jgi:transcriptional regulator with XRE-family HTH domain
MGVEAVPQKLSDVVAERVVAIRRSRGLTQTALATEVARRGLPGMDQRMLSKIERGTRAVSLDEAVVLAAALNTTPLALLLPEDPAALVSVTGRADPRAAEPVVVTGKVFARWLLGHAPLEKGAKRLHGYAESLPAVLLESIWDRIAVGLRELADRVEDEAPESRRVLLNASTHVDFLLSEDGGVHGSR